MESIKAFWKTRAYSRIFIDNIGKQGFSPEIIYYKIKSSEGKERIIFLYYSTSKTYTNRSFPGTVNASDPIISTGLSESILKKQTDKQMLLVRRKGDSGKQKLPKNPYGFERLHFTLFGVQNSTRNFKRLSA